MKLSKTKLAVMLTLAINVVYAAEFDYTGHDFLNNSALNKITYDGSDASMLDMLKSLYPKDSNNNTISNSNVTYVKGTGNTDVDTVFGGSCHSITNMQCNTVNTTIVMDSGLITNGIYGAYASVEGDINGSTKFSAAIGNAYLNGGIVNNYVVGANAAATSLNNNHNNNMKSNAVGNVYFNNGITSHIFGAYALSTGRFLSSSNAAGEVYLNGGQVIDNVNGANAQAVSTFNGYATAIATGKVSLANTAVNGNVYGATADTLTLSTTNLSNDTANATGYVNFSSGIVRGNIYGAYINNGYNVNATSYITIFNDAKLQTYNNNGDPIYNSEIWGGYSNLSQNHYYEIFKNNTFTMGANPLTVSKIGNFEYYNFILNNYNKNVINTNTALVTVNTSISNSDSKIAVSDGTMTTVTNKSIAKIEGISGLEIINIGDKVILINAENATFEGGDNQGNMTGLFNINSNNTVKVGLVSEADISYDIDEINSKYVATINDIRVSTKKLNTNIKPLAQGRLAALMNVNRGADDILIILAKNEKIGSFTPIAKISGGINKYGNSQSNIDANDYRLTIGSRYQMFENLYTGIALEYGVSNYDTNNQFKSSNINGSGNAKSYGVTIFGKYTHIIDDSEAYADVAFRFGRTSNDYRSNDIITGSGKAANYDSKANYIGGLLGLGYKFDISTQYGLDTAIHYFFTRLRSNNVTIDGDKIEFKNSTSSRLQLREQLNYKASDITTVYLAAAYEYEFDSKAKTSAVGIDVTAPSAQGSTGVMELGIKSMPLTNNQNLSLDLNFKGYSGERKGITASIYTQYSF